MLGKLKRALSREDGQALLIGIFVFAALTASVAISLDVGAGFGERARIQSAADAAALAATDALEDGKPAAQVLKAAEDWAEANGYVDGSDGATVIVNIPPASGPYAGDNEYVEVIISKATDTYFASLFGQDFWDISARAVGGGAAPNTAAGTDASIVSLNPAACTSVEIAASAAFTSQGPIMINSDCASYAAEFECSSICKAQGGIESVGGVLKDNKCKPCNVTNIGHFADPLAAVLPPCFPNSPVPCQDVGLLTVRNGTPANPQLMSDSNFALQPGIYYGGIEYNPGTARTMAPGIYVIAGGGFKLNPSASFTANGVFIYNTNDPDCPGCSQGPYGPFLIDTGANANFSPMTTGPYAGLLMFQDRNNSETAVFNPSANFGEGTIYMPSAHVILNPSADLTVQIISDTVMINNSAAFTAIYQGDVFYSGGEGGFIRLVE